MKIENIKEASEKIRSVVSRQSMDDMSWNCVEGWLSTIERELEKAQPSLPVEQNVRQGRDVESGEVWRRVEEIKPPENREVIFYSPHYKVVSSWYDGKYNVDENVYLTDVTHWRPLPEPPDA